MSKNIAYVEGDDNVYGACNDVRESHDTVVPTATGSGLDCLRLKYGLEERIFAPLLTRS
jgi:hypothetical protein